MKIIWHRISKQILLFQACLPTRQNGVENRDKAYSSVLLWPGAATSPSAVSKFCGILGNGQAGIYCSREP